MTDTDLRKIIWLDSNTIAQNKKARHDYTINERFEAGMVLQGWEVKSLREGKCQMVDSYVFVKNGEAWVSNLLITPLMTASTHITPAPTRVRCPRCRSGVIRSGPSFQRRQD